MYKIVKKCLKNKEKTSNLVRIFGFYLLNYFLKKKNKKKI